MTPEEYNALPRRKEHTERLVRIVRALLGNEVTPLQRVTAHVTAMTAPHAHHVVQAADGAVLPPQHQQWTLDHTIAVRRRMLEIDGRAGTIVLAVAVNRVRRVAAHVLRERRGRDAIAFAAAAADPELG